MKDSKGKERKYFSYNEITKETIEQADPHTGQSSAEPKNFITLRQQAARIGDIEDQLRTPLDKQFWALHTSLGMYLALKASLRPPDSPDFVQELNT